MRTISSLVLSVPLICSAGMSQIQRSELESKPYRIDVKHIESKGIGYNQGYSTLEGFFTSQRGNCLPFLDLRAHVFNDGRWAANAGVGARYLLSNSMLGVNGYYDYRKTKHLHCNQVGLGVEAFLNAWEFRANGYLPIGDKSKTLSNELRGVSFKAFSGNNILINEHYVKKNASAMRGFNAEIGVHPCRFGPDYDLFLGASGYYFNADNGETTWGGKLRAKAKISQYFFVELSDSYDHVFRNRFQGAIALSIPLGKKHACSQKRTNNALCWNALLPVERQEIIVVHKRKMHYTIDPIAIDLTTGLPFFVLFVDNTNTQPTPNGTFENPFANLTAADGVYNAQDASNPGDIIYVFPGSSSAFSQIGMSNGFTLQQGQRFLGSGISNRFLTTKGVLTIPSQTATAPSISKNNSIVIALVDNNEISGTNLYALGGTAIACIGSDASSIDGATITRNVLTGTSASASSRGISLATILTGTFIIDRNTIVSQASSGVRLVPSNGPLSIVMTNNTTSNTGSHGLFVDTTSPTNPTTTIFMDNNYTTNASTAGSSGIFLTGNRDVSATVTNNRCDSNDDSGIFLFYVSGSNITCDVRDNITNDNQQSGITLACPFSGCIRFNENSASGNGVHPFFWVAGTAPTCQVELPIGNVGNIDTGAVSVELVPVGTCGLCTRQKFHR